jgi:flagellin
MTRINTNVSSLIAQKTLTRSNTTLQQALTRLSTGLRINAGKDDPAGLIASESLRSDIVSVQRAITNSERADKMIATADSALGQISSLLNDIRGLVTEAANDGAMSADQIAANQLQIDSSLEAINRIAQTTTFQGKKLLDGSLDFITTNWTNPTNVSDLEITQANLGALGYIDVSVIVNTEASVASINTTINSGAQAATATLSGFEDDASASLTITADSNGEAYNNYTVSFYETNAVAADAPEVMVDNENKTITIYVNDSAATALADIAAAFDDPWVSGFSAEDDGGSFVYTPGGDDADITGTTSGGASNGLSADLVIELSGAKGSQVFSFEAGTSISDPRVGHNPLLRVYRLWFQRLRRYQHDQRLPILQRQPGHGY